MNDYLLKFKGVRSFAISLDDAMKAYDLIVKSNNLSELLIELYDSDYRGLLNKLPRCPGCNKINSSNTRSVMNHYRFCNQFRLLIKRAKVHHPFEYTGDPINDDRIHKLHHDNAMLQIKRGTNSIVYSNDPNHNKLVFERLSNAGKLGSKANYDRYGCAFPNCSYDESKGDDYNKRLREKLSRRARIVMQSRTGFGRRSIIKYQDKVFYLNSIPEFIGFCYLHYILNFTMIDYELRFEDDHHNSFYTDFVINNKYNIEIHPDGLFHEKEYSKLVFENHGIKTIFIPCSRTYSWNRQLLKIGFPIDKYLDEIVKLDKLHKKFVFDLTKTELQLC